MASAADGVERHGQRRLRERDRARDREGEQQERKQDEQERRPVEPGVHGPLQRAATGPPAPPSVRLGGRHSAGYSRNSTPG